MVPVLCVVVIAADDGTLYDLFTSWYPAMPADDGQPLPFAAAA
jgi:hypothetical protein